MLKQCYMVVVISFISTLSQAHPIGKNPVVQELLKPDTPQKTVIFDMGDVLVRLHSTKLGLSKVGLLRLLTYCITHPRSVRHIKTLVTELYSAANSSGSMTLINEYQGCTKELHYYHNFIEARSNELAAQGRYASTTEKDIILELARVTFDPEHFANHTSPIPDGVQLLQACAKTGHRIVILSNWDMYSFPYLQEKYPEIFEYINPEDIFVSAQIGKLKPNSEAFEHVLNATESNAENCVFFDDKQENCDAASSLGIAAVQFAP